MTGAYFLLHLFVVKSDDEDLHEVFGSDLSMEWSCALIHEHVKQSQSEKHDFGLICAQTLVYLVGSSFATTV